MTTRQILASGVITTLAILVLVSAGRDRSPLPKKVLLSDGEMKRIMGGHGGAGCDQCAYAPLTLHECAHFSYSDPCSATQCIENILTEDTCAPAAQSDCWTELDPSLAALTQRLKDLPTGLTCSTNNTSTWNIWVTHYYGSSCSTRTYMTRCEMSSGGCTGNVVKESVTYNGISCI